MVDDQIRHDPVMWPVFITTFGLLVARSTQSKHRAAVTALSLQGLMWAMPI